jgi:hypothetical protein
MIAAMGGNSQHREWDRGTLEDGEDLNDLPKKGTLHGKLQPRCESRCPFISDASRIHFCLFCFLSSLVLLVTYTHQFSSYY